LIVKPTSGAISMHFQRCRWFEYIVPIENGAFVAARATHIHDGVHSGA